MCVSQHSQQVGSDGVHVLLYSLLSFTDGKREIIFTCLLSKSAVVDLCSSPVLEILVQAPSCRGEHSGTPSFEVLCMRFVQSVWMNVDACFSQASFGRSHHGGVQTEGAIFRVHYQPMQVNHMCGFYYVYVEI